MGLRALAAETAEAVLTSLAGQLPRARSIRWISSDAITRNLTEKLHAAQAAISRRRPESAGDILRALREESAAQSGKGLTSEAVALLDLNIRYALRLAAKP